MASTVVPIHAGEHIAPAPKPEFSEGPTRASVPAADDTVAVPRAVLEQLQRDAFVRGAHAGINRAAELVERDRRRKAKRKAKHRSARASRQANR